MGFSERLIPNDPTAFKRNNFDAIRMAMALLVVWSHSFAIYLGTEDNEPLSLLMNGAYDSGKVAVLVFFIISGFLITHSFLNSKSVSKYFYRRVSRIYPGYIVATLISVSVIVPAFSSRTLSDFTSTEVVKALGLNLLLQGYFPASDAFNGTSINGSLWSISYEFWCYVGLAALGIVGLLKNRFACLTITLLVMAIRVWLDLTGRHPGGGFVGAIIGYPYLWFVVLPCFMMGACFYLYRDVIPRSSWAVLSGLCMLALAPNLPLEPLHGKILTNIILPPVIAYATLYVAFSKSIKLYDAAKWGDFSYGTYLYAYPIQKMLFATFGGALIFPRYIAVSLALSSSAGVMSWYLIERWFLSRRVAAATTSVLYHPDDRVLNSQSRTIHGHVREKPDRSITSVL
jgi:peptidoglycan/LPS O-acetylase OafA/YrhL